MQNRRIILFFLALSALCSAALFLTRRGARLPPGKNGAPAALADGPLDWVDHITVEHGDARVGLIRQEGRWVMTAPFSAQVDQSAVLRLLDAFETARVRNALPFHEMRKRGESLRAFGLDPSRAALLLEGENRRLVFRIGARSPLGADVYLLRDGAEQILAAPAALAEALPPDADGVRSRRLSSDDLSRADAVEIRSPGKPFISLAKSPAGWRISQPSEGPASEPAAAALLAAIGGARVDAFVWPTVSNVMDAVQFESALAARRALYGLDAERGLAVRIRPAPGRAPLQWVFGRASSERPALTYALLQNGEAIGLVSNAVADSFRIPPAALLERRLFPAAPADVRRLKIQQSGPPFVLTQTNGIWRLEEPVAAPADQARARAAVAGLLRLDAEPPAAAANAIERPAPFCRAELSAGGPAPRAFSLSHDDVSGAFLRIAFRGAPGFSRVAASNLPPAFLTAAGLLDLCGKEVAAIPPAGLRRITRKDRSGRCEQIERPGPDAPWRPAGGPAPRQIRAPAVEALTERLAGLRADRIEKLGPLSLKEREAYGFREPWLELNIDVESADAVRKTILVGASPGFGKRYALLLGRDVLFLLDAPALEALSAPLLSEE